MLSSCMKQVEKNPMSQKQMPWYKIPPKRWRNKPNRNCIWENDSQRQKLYDAQYHAKCIYPLFREKQLPSIEAIQRYVNRLVKSAWFRTRFGEHSITAKTKKGYGACARKGDNTIRFSANSRTVFTVLHEVAHIVHTFGAGGSHGRFFARTLIELIEHEFGKEAAKILKQAFKKGRVKYLPKRELSEETREKLRQGFIKRVLKRKV